jgi:DNA-binding MarR family transcriptional regulator
MKDNKITKYQKVYYFEGVDTFISHGFLSMVKNLKQLTASNNYIGRHLFVSDKYISRLVKKLQDKGLIKVVLKGNRYRTITLTDKCKIIEDVIDNQRVLKEQPKVIQRAPLGNTKSTLRVPIEHPKVIQRAPHIIDDIKEDIKDDTKEDTSTGTGVFDNDFILPTTKKKEKLKYDHKQFTQQNDCIDNLLRQKNIE